MTIKDLRSHERYEKKEGGRAVGEVGKKGPIAVINTPYIRCSLQYTVFKKGTS